MGEVKGFREQKRQQRKLERGIPDVLVSMDDIRLHGENPDQRLSRGWR
jgi:hypothetical protein